MTVTDTPRVAVAVIDEVFRSVAWMGERPSGAGAAPAEADGRRPRPATRSPLRDYARELQREYREQQAAGAF
jgi:hypothetical protein